MTDTTSTLHRRDVLTMIGGAGLAALASSAASAQEQPARARPNVLNSESLGWDASTGKYFLPKLPYAYDALEPVIDAKTMEIHHSKHHAGYVKGLNTALAAIAKIQDGSGDASLIKHWERELAFNGGGHVNHSLLWLNMAPPSQGGGGRPSGALAEAIDKHFGSFDEFSKYFQASANSVEGSGWGWLVFSRISGRLVVQQMEKQQDMLITGVIPLLGVDVWEHAYYLKYQNRRGDYTKAWMDVINWPNVEKMYEYVST